MLDECPTIRIAYLYFFACAVQKIADKRKRVQSLWFCFEHSVFFLSIQNITERCLCDLKSMQSEGFKYDYWIFSRCLAVKAIELINMNFAY